MKQANVGGGGTRNRDCKSLNSFTVTSVGSLTWYQGGHRTYA